MPIVYGSEYISNNEATYDLLSSTKIDSSHFIVSFQKSSGGYPGVSTIGTISSETQIAFGSQYTHATSAGSTSLIDSTHFVVAGPVKKGDVGFARVGTISNGNQIAYGTSYTFNGGATIQGSYVSVLDSTHFVIVYRDYADSQKGKCVIGTISGGTTIAFGSEYEFQGTAIGTVDTFCAKALDSTHFVVVYKTAAANPGICIVGTVSNGNEVAFGSTYTCSDVGSKASLTVVSPTKFVLFGMLYTTGVQRMNAIVGNITNGNEIAFGAKYYPGTATTGDFPSIDTINGTSFVVTYQDVNDSSKGKSFIGSIIGSDQVSFSPVAIFNNADTREQATAVLDATDFTSKFAISYIDNGNSSKGTSIIGDSSPSTYIAKFNNIDKANLKGINFLDTVNIKNINGLI